MAVTDKDPSGAIALVEQMTDTFKKIVVGQEGQFVPVPGHPDQPTLAERVKQNLKPSTDAAAGFAAQASASAKAADESATRAAQIAGLETVAEAVGMAALPFPDVWLPLSDSLNMLAGYGEELKIGEHVVARKASFSRNSTARYVGKDGLHKTATANEPRFEKEGLLIEGQSTDIVLVSTPGLGAQWAKSKNGTGVEPDVTTNHGIAPDGTLTACRVVMDRGAGSSSSDFSFFTCTAGGAQVGKPLTLSGWMRSTDSSSECNVMMSLNGSAMRLVTVTGAWQRFSTTLASAEDVNRYPRFSLRGGDGSSEKADFLLWGVQLEVLPFATSYIPTNGAAVTRAADALRIPMAGNLPTDELTFCVNVADYNVDGSVYGAVVIAPELSSASGRLYLGFSSAGVTFVIGNKSTRPAAVPIPGSPIGFAISTKTGRFKLFYNGAIQSSGTFEGPVILRSELSIGNYSPASPGGSLNGHIRNLRIWHKFLTDEQIKALK